MRSGPYFVLFALWLAGHAFPFDCRELYRSVQRPAGLFEAKTGKLLTQTPERTTYEMGSGNDGVTVRVVPSNPSQPTFIEKTYKPNAASQRTRDVEMLEKLGELAAKRPVGFKIARAKLAGGPTVHLEDVAGRDLHSLLMDASISQPLKTRLRETYRRNAQAMVAALEAEYQVRMYKSANIEDGDAEMFRDRSLDGEGVYFAELKPGDRDTKLLIRLKTDNVIVHFREKDGQIEMTLVDPR